MKRMSRELRLHPALLFFGLTIIVMIVSSIGSLLDLEASYYTINKISGDLETNVITINNLFNRTGIQYLVSHMIKNFINFEPLSTFIVGLAGVGVAYKTGFLNSLFRLCTKNVSRKLITFLVVLLGVISSMFFEVGYVILIPLAAILFLNIGRHPSVGICAAFSGISFGYGANIVVNGLDGLLREYTSSASSILDSAYKVSLSGNLIFMIISTILISYVGMIITERYIVPKLGKYNMDEEEELDFSIEVTEKEKKGVIISLGVMLVIVLCLIYCIIPGLPFSGLFLYLKDATYIEQLFGDNSYFRQGVVFLIGTLILMGGLIYGLRVKAIKNNRDLVDGMNYYLKSVSSILILMFFASQFCSIFKETNIGTFVVASLAEVLSNLKLSGILLVIISFLFIMICGFFVPSASTKWAIISPIMVPMFMTNSLTPEFAQAVFRAADSAVKGFTPMFSYFVILIGFLQIYNKKNNEVITLTDALSLMIPYVIGFSILWLLIVLAFYIIGIPLGIDVGVML